MKKQLRKKLTTWQILALGYLVAIILGAGLLVLPFATQAGEEKTSFLNALFTSTSATCVTGLIAYDTNTHWSLFGQIVILCLIQLGGLGFMTFVTVLLQIFGKNLGLATGKILMATAGEERRSGIRRLFKRILLGTLIFEGLGAILLAVRFVPQFGWGKGVYYSIWHSVSAFCNAGFDLMGGVFEGEKFLSLTRYATDPLVSLTIAALIIIGGLGFCVWDDLLESKFRYKRFRLHTKVVVIMTLMLIVIPTPLFMIFERNNPDLAEYTFWEKLLISVFSVVTPRTAGFNTVNMANFSDSTYLLYLILMFIGGSSGSTAGGVKVTTFFVIIMSMAAVFRGNRDIEVGKRRIHNALTRQALAIFVSCLFIVVTACIVICAIEQNNGVATFQAVVFEAVSAMATVGLSMSLSPTLSAASKIIIILLMYAGRVGILTLGLAFSEKKSTAEIKKPVDSLLIG